MPDKVTMTEWQLQLLSNIFRLIVKEITCDEDKLLLAPGEIGMSYEEGTFYVRDPHTGELVTPNSLGHIQQILSKYEPGTNILNADKVTGIKFYSNISQLSQIGTSMSPDTVIRQMEYPAVLISPVEYLNYEAMSYPSDSGMFIVFKISPEFVYGQYYDNHTMCVYQCLYNPFTQQFKGWSRIGTSDTIYLETVGGGDRTKIFTDKPVGDMTVLTVRVTQDLYGGAEVSLNNGAFQPILTLDGERLADTITANNIIMLIYDDKRHAWIYADGKESSIVSVVEIMQQRVNKVVSDLDLAVQDYRERLAELSRRTDQQIDALKTRPGVIRTVISEVVIQTNDVDIITGVTGFDQRYDKLVVMFNQTVFQPNLDYSIASDGTIEFKNNIKFAKNDVLQFIVLKQATPAE